MIKRILYLIRIFPEQVALFVFNSGIFLWISQKGQAISHELGIQQAWENYAPEGVRQFSGTIGKLFKLSSPIRPLLG